MTKIRIGMVGGGFDSMIGNVHRYALHLDNQYELVCGVFSNSREKSQRCGALLNLDPQRIYNDYKDMFEQERALPAEKRMDVVSILTPNHLHFDVAQLAIESDFNVILEKPITRTLQEAKALEKLTTRKDKLMCVLYTFAGYPMIKEAKNIIQSGTLGGIKKIAVEFYQGWLANFHTENWRTCPEKTGISGTIADIGVHAFHLVEYVTGLKAQAVYADINIIGEQRKLDDDAAIFLKYDQGVNGIVCVSQVASGEEANIKIKIYGEQGSLIWEHDQCNSLFLKWLNKPAEMLRSGKDNHYLSVATRYYCRLPAGHPEGFIEAFANHYRNFAYCLQAKKKCMTTKPEWNDYPKIAEGVRGIAFIEAAVKSHRLKKWQRL